MRLLNRSLFAFVAMVTFCCGASSAPKQLTIRNDDMIRNGIVKAFGSKRGTYFVKNRLISTQILMALPYGIPVRVLPDGSLFEAGWRMHSADEMSAVIATRTGQFLAAGIVHYPCVFTNAKYAEKGCASQATLTIFVTRKGDQSKHVNRIESWARKIFADKHDRYETWALAHVEKKRLSLR